MRKNIFLILFIFIIISAGFSSEIRMEAMGAKSALGHYVVPDDWCDTFYSNPCFSVFIDKWLINADSNLNLTKKTFESSTIDLSVRSLNNYGMIMPFDKFSAGLRLNGNVYMLFEKKIYDSNENYQYSSTGQSHIISPEILFAWKINPDFSFGFNIKNNTVIFESFNLTAGDLRSVDQVDFDFSNNFGFLIKKNKNTISITVPFNIGYQQYWPSESYFSVYNTWSYWNETTSFSAGIVYLTDIFVNNYTSLRINADAKFHLNYLNRIYILSDDFAVMNKNANYKSLSYGIPVTVSFSVYNKINENVLLFYGLDSIHYFNPYYDMKNRNTEKYYYVSFYMMHRFGLFIGGEFTVLKWLTVRLGITSSIFDYTYFNNDNNDPDKNTAGFPLQTNINAGIAVKANDNFTIELNSGFLLMNLNYKHDTDYFTGSDNQDFSNLNFKGSIGFVFRF